MHSRGNGQGEIKIGKIEEKKLLKQKRNPKRAWIGNEDANQENSSQAPSEIEKMGDTESNIWKFGKQNIDVNTEMLSYGTRKD